MKRFGVYPLVGDQVHFQEELYNGHDRVAAELAARRNTKHHPLGVILLERASGHGWVWRDDPPLKAHPVQLMVNREDTERWFKEWAESYLRQHRQ